ncbi:hypothetical protein BGZ81_009473 [Podila clonocystis]|nr:hypothetical protein BGZ81_009473 [Podila clonocystis]
MKIAQVIAVLAFTTSLCLARVCQDGDLAQGDCSIRSAYHICADFCPEANPDGCDDADTGCPIKSTCEKPHGAVKAYACCECGCRQGDGWCEHKPNLHTMPMTTLKSDRLHEDQTVVEILKTMSGSGLTTLDLWSNKIGDNGAQVLAKALKINSTLTTLSLAYSSYSLSS